MRYYLRNPTATLVSHPKHCLFIIPGTEPISLELDGATLHPTLQKASKPASLEEMLRLSSQDSLELLVESGVLLEGTKESLSQLIMPSPPRPKVCRRLLLGVSGAVSASAIHQFVINTILTFCESIDIILTKAAMNFVQPSTLLLPGVNVWSDPFEPRGEISVPHIHLANTADIVLILPASASTIAKLANGLCSDLLSLTVAATQAPVVIAPAMNGAMRTHPAVSRNIEQLQRDGMYLIEPSFSWEMSKGPNSEMELGGLGVEASEISKTLEAILLVHQGEG